MEKTKKMLGNWKLHLTVLVICVISEIINLKKIPLGNGSIMFLPLLYAMLFGLVLYLIKPVKWIGDKESEDSDTFVVVGIALFLAKVSVTSGTQLADIIAAGPALILQELGNLGTIFLALPIALLLGFKREAVGMTHSIGREPNVGLIASKYGLNSPEGRGVMITYITGTLIGTVFIGLLASFLAVVTPLHPFAMAMACGVGSGSMMAASSAALTQTFPDLADQITAYAATSNVLSNADGVLVTVIIGLPICNKLYSVLEPKIGKKKNK